MPLFSSGAWARLALRQSDNNNNTCTTNEGVGECRPRGNCPGVSTPGICPPENDDIECCLVRVCNVTQGTGVCRSMKNNGCQDGKFFAGTGRPWPCPGPDDISCCVKYVDMNNGTSTTPSSSMPMTSGSQTTSPSTNSATSSSVPSETGLNGGQIGGIAAGCAVFALLIAIGAVYFFRRRKPAAAEEEKPDTSDSTISEMPDSAGVVPRAPQKKIVSELDSEEKKPDKSVVINQARELDSTPIASPVELDASPVEDGGYKV